VKSVFQWIASSGLVCALVLGGLAPVQGQEKVQSKERKGSSSHEVRRVSMVIGGGVQIAGGVSVGKIEDIVINDRGCIDYVVVVYHDKYVPIPWTVTTVDFSKRIVTVDITEERFAEVPTFTRDDFSVFAKAEFTEKVHSSFGGKAGSKASSSKKSEAAEPEKKSGEKKADVKKSDEKKSDKKTADEKKSDDKKPEKKADDKKKKSDDEK